MDAEERDGLSSPEEHEKLRRLRRKIKVLREEREIPRIAAAISANVPTARTRGAPVA